MLVEFNYVKHGTFLLTVLPVDATRDVRVVSGSAFRVLNPNLVLPYTPKRPNFTLVARRLPCHIPTPYSDGVQSSPGNRVWRRNPFR